MNPEKQNVKSDVSVKVSPATVGCLILLVSFFLPWIRILGTGVAGNEIPRLASNWMWLWLIPIAAAAAIALELTGRRHTEVAQIAGGLPFVALAIGLYQNGTQLLSALLIGAYGTLLSSLFLLSIAPRLSKKKAAVSS
ncbi:MAG TPA: hypothetical protein VG710_13710 [Opitutus sp.]|nr:hypothetical protein [Opitutus sp.]